MTPKVLRSHIKPLPEYLPLTKALEDATGVGAGYDSAWYRSQKEHWLGWLGEYDGPGAYGRSDAAQRNGEYIYNHIQCAPMLFWLAEACDIARPKLELAFEAVAQVERKGARQCAALRRTIPWSEIERGLNSWRYGWMDRCRIELTRLVG